MTTIKEVLRQLMVSTDIVRDEIQEVEVWSESPMASIDNDAAKTMIDVFSSLLHAKELLAEMIDTLQEVNRGV